MLHGSIEKRATVTSKGQVTIPVEIRKALGLKDGDPVTFTYEGGVVTIRSAHKPTLTELLQGFDPEKHRHGPEDRFWDDEPRGREAL